MIAVYLDDPRHRESEKLAFAAERYARGGAVPEALEGFANAACLEESVAASVSLAEPRERTLLAISAVCLWLKARQWDEAARSGCSFLALPRALTPDGNRELVALVDRAWRSRELDAHFVGRSAYVGVETRLDVVGVLKAVNLRGEEPSIVVSRKAGRQKGFASPRASRTTASGRSSIAGCGFMASMS